MIFCRVCRKQRVTPPHQESLHAHLLISNPYRQLCLVSLYNCCTCKGTDTQLFSLHVQKSPLPTASAPCLHTCWQLPLQRALLSEFSISFQRKDLPNTYPFLPTFFLGQKSNTEVPSGTYPGSPTQVQPLEVSMAHTHERSAICGAAATKMWTTWTRGRHHCALKLAHTRNALLFRPCKPLTTTAGPITRCWTRLGSEGSF